MARTYRELIVWQRGTSLAEATYSFTKSLPDVERFGLVTQLRRCSVSIPSNIAEGHERRSRAEYRRFIAIACGSLAELETQIELSKRLCDIDNETTMRVIDLCEETGCLLRAVERGLRDKSAIALASPQRSALSPDP